MQCLVLKYKVMSLSKPSSLACFAYLSEQDYDVRQRPSWLSMTQDCVLNCSAGPWRKGLLVQDKSSWHGCGAMDVACLQLYKWNLWSMATCISVRNILEYSRNLFRTSQAFRPQLREAPKHGTSFEDPSFFMKHIQVATKWPDFLDGILSEQLSLFHKKLDSSFSWKLVTSTLMFSLGRGCRQCFRSVS